MFNNDRSSDIKESIGSIVSSILIDQKAEKYDPERDYLVIPAPNIIEFVHSPQYLNIPSIFKHKRQYQILRDFFQCRCPICNPVDPESIDCWDKDREYLESENLLVWSTKYGDDICPKCNTTRTEFREDRLLHKYNQLHGIVGMRSCMLKCGMIITNLGLISGKELLTLNNIIPQKGVRHNQQYNININVFGENGIEPASHIIYEGIKPSKIIETQCGWKIEVSTIHPMRVLSPDLTRNWVQSKDLTVGDYLMVKSNTNLWGSKELNSARAIGYLIADGSISSDNLNFTCNSEELTIDCVKQIKIFDINVIYKKRKGMDAFYWSTKNKNAKNKLTELSIGNWCSKEKEVPLSIRQSTKNTVREFLRAYLSCDGWCSILSSGKSTSGKQHYKSQVGFDTVSEKLARQVQYLLLNFGIFTSLSKTKSRKFSSNEKYDHYVYMVRINSEYIQKFKDEIGFIDKDKQKELDRCIDLINATRRRSNLNNIINSADILRQYLKDIDIGEGCRLDNKGNIYKNAVTTGIFGKSYDSIRACWKRKNKSISKEIIKIVVDATRELGKKHSPDLLRRFDDFLDESWIYLPIESIEDGECEMADLHVPNTHSFIVNGFLNHNSGKTATAGMIGSYVEHRLINLALTQPDCKLANYFGVLPKQPFEVTYIASTEVQSNDTIWAYYKSFRIDSPWFRRYVKWVKKKEKSQDTPEGMERWVYKETIREIENGHMYVKFNSKNSNSGGLAGRTRIASFVDELCRFKQTESSLGADEAYRVMENSLRTVRSAVENHNLIYWLGLIASISSPISVEDKGMDLLYKSTNIKRMYSFHYATWEFNPEEKREYYNEAYEKDPVGTERDFGAKPPLAANPLIIDPEKFEARAIDPNLIPTATIEVIPFIDKTGQRYHKAVMTDCSLRRDASRFVVFDAGQNFDSFAGACGHLEMKQLEDESFEYITVIDWIMRVLPSEDMEVWFDACVDIIKTQKQRQKIVKVEFDRWNSVTLIQQIRNTGIHAEQKSIKPEHYINFVSDSILGRVKLLPKEPDDDELDPPFKSPAAIGIYELERLERSIDDKRVYNPRKGKKRGWNSDDVAVVLVHLHHLCQDSQVMPTGAKLRSREARLKREEINGQQYQMGNMGSIFSPNRSKIGGIRRW